MYLKPSTFLIIATFLAIFFVAESSMLDDELIELHHQFLTEDEMDGFHRQLRFGRFKKWIAKIRGHKKLDGDGNNTNDDGNDNRAVNKQNESNTMGFGGHNQNKGSWDNGDGWNGGGSWNKWNGKGTGHGDGEGGHSTGSGGGGLTDEEHDVIRGLLNNRRFIDRTREELYDLVTNKFIGMKTVTTSSNGVAANYIKTHVEQMLALVEEDRLARQRDPLYKELFQHKDDIAIVVTDLPNGISIVQTSTDNCAARLIEEHSKVVSGFIEKGQLEVRANHAVPSECS